MNLLHSIKALENDTIVNVVVEIPKGSNEKTEYKVDQEKFVVDRVLSSNLTFPFNYGFVPETWSNDNDPLDVAIISSETFPTGTALQARIVGLLETIDQSGIDSKLITIPVSEKDPALVAIQDTDTLDKETLSNIEYFYKNYKINEPGKWVDINGYLSAEEAKSKVKDSIKRYHQHFQK